MIKKRLIKGICSVLLMTSLVLGSVFSVDLRAATFADINAPEVFTKQPPGSVTCTLHANAMMLRRTAILRGDEDWESITADAMYSTCWVSGQGMRWGYTYKDITVGQAALPSTESEKKTFLIDFLKKHPEGIALFDQHKPHGVLLTDYTDGVFYYADPSSGVVAGRNPITSSSLVTIATADKYWYVMTPSVVLETPDISNIETPKMDGVVSGDSIKISGWSISMKEITAVKCTVNDSVTLDCTRYQREDVAALNPGYPKGMEGYSCDVSSKDLIYGTNTVRVDTYVDEEIISTSTVTFELEYTANIMGDVNHDCMVDVKDAVVMKMHLAGTDVDIDKDLSDLNVDTVVDTIDAVMIMRYLAGSGEFLEQ